VHDGHACQPKVPNSQPVPGGTCTGILGGRACVSGVCDTNDNLCGYRNGDGPCTGTNGGVVCRSTICATSGPNMGLCEACFMNMGCSLPQVCDPTTDTCGVPDGGVAMDAGVDAGAADGGGTGDGGSAGDAGPRDGGAQTDGGGGSDAAPAGDSGPGPARDAGAKDSGGGLADSALDAAPDLGTLEGGGCACTTAGEQRGPAAPAGALGAGALGLAVLAVRRRKRG
jgi:MYXO-CTERM domain-containing protein